MSKDNREAELRHGPEGMGSRSGREPTAGIFLHWLETDGRFYRNGDLGDFLYSASLKILFESADFLQMLPARS